MLVFLFLFLSSHTQAFEKQLQAFVVQKEKVAKEFGDEVLQALYDYRKEVEKNAYQNTLQLCEGYRRAKGLGPHPAHGKYMFSANDAASAWGKIIVEGAKQPISGTFGQKADFLHYGRYGMFSWDSWFQSMYTMYLVNSFGFLGGAVHCLGTIDESEIQKFALAIVDVDIAASSITIAGGLIVTFFIPELLFPKIVQATKFVFRPVVKLFSLMGFRIGNTVPLKVAGITISGVIADNFLIYLENKDQFQTELQDLINPDSDAGRDSAQRKRFLLLTKTFQLFYKLYQDEKKLREQSGSGACQACQNLYKPYYEYLIEHYSKELLITTKADFENLSSKYFLSQEETLYFELLNAYLPILNEHFLISFSNF